MLKIIIISGNGSAKSVQQIIKRSRVDEQTSSSLDDDPHIPKELVKLYTPQIVALLSDNKDFAGNPWVDDREVLYLMLALNRIDRNTTFDDLIEMLVDKADCSIMKLQDLLMEDENEVIPYFRMPQPFVRKSGTKLLIVVNKNFF